MNPQDLTYSQAVDPRTPPELLTLVAQTRPDLFPALALNPAIPQDMEQWLRGLNNPQVNAALMQRGGQAPPPPVTEFGASAPNFGPPGPDSAPPAAAFAPSSTNDGPPAAAFTPPTQEFGTPGYSTQQNFQSVPPMSGSGPDYVAQSRAYMDQPGAPTKSKRGMIIGIVVAAVLLIGGGVWAANHFLFSKLGGAETPQAAVEQLLAGLENQDAIAIYGALSPVDTEWFSGLGTSFTKHFEDQIDSTDVFASGQEYLEAFSLQSTDVTYDVEQITEDYARVSITGGNFVIDADADKVAASTNALLDSLKGGDLEELILDSGGTFPTHTEIEQEIGEGIAESFPFDFTAADLSMDLEGFGDDLDIQGLSDPYGKDWDAEPNKEQFYLVASKEDGSWFISPVLTTADYQAKIFGTEADYSRISEVDYADSPEQAATNLVTGLSKVVTDLELDSLHRYLVLAERRMSIGAPEIPLDEYDREQYRSMVGESIQISDAEFSVDRTEGDLAYLKLESLKITAQIEGSYAEVVLSSDCTKIDVEGMQLDLCLRDIPAAQELGLDQLRLIAVKEKGGWVIGSNQSGADGLGILGSNVLRLANEGKLTDSQWWIDNSGVLYQYLEEF